MIKGIQRASTEHTSINNRWFPSRFDQKKKKRKEEKKHTNKQQLKTKFYCTTLKARLNWLACVRAAMLRAISHLLSN